MRRGVTAEDLRQARADLDRPTATAEGLPGRFYAEDFYHLEQETLFPRGWCAVTVGAAIPEPGDILPVDLAGWPVLVLRDRDGTIRAFHNICRHRGLQLVREPCRKARLVRCPWHSWSYDLAGNLLATPEVGGPGAAAAEGFDKADLGLKPIPVAQWLDYVFVNLDGLAAPFDAHIAPLAELVADLNLDDLHHGGRLDEIYRANWKLSTESGLEDYHLLYGHPQLNAQQFRNNTFCGAPGVYSGGLVSLGAESGKPGAEGTQSGGLPAISRRDGGPLPNLILLNIFPNGTALISPSHVMIGFLLPDGPAVTRLQLHFYFKGDAATSAEHEVAREAALDSWREVVPQDFPFIEGTQATILTRDGAGIRTRFSPYWETAIHLFQRSVLDAVA